MKFRRRFLMIPVIFGLGAALVGWGYGSHGPCGRWGRDPAKMERHMTAFLDDRLDDLDASDSQRKQIHALAKDLHGELKSLHGERDDMREQFLSFWESESPDPQAVHAAIDARVEKLRALAHKAADAGLKAHGVLDAKQRAEVAEAIRERHGAK